MNNKTVAPPKERRKSAQDLAVCAHDLRSTLTVIAGYANTLRRHPQMPESQREQALAGIEGAVRRADRMICDTLDGIIATGSSNGQISLAPLVVRAAADSRAASARDVRDHITSDALVSADETSIARVLDNLLSNAAKYAPSGPIDIGLTTEGPVAIIEVADRGPGIPVSDRKTVFEPFVRLDRDAAAPGSGLGLTVVNSVVSRMGGYVKIDDRPGGGALIRLYLPLA